MWSSLLSQATDLASQAQTTLTTAASTVTNQAISASEALQTETDKLAISATNAVSNTVSNFSETVSQVSKNLQENPIDISTITRNVVQKIEDTTKQSSIISEFNKNQQEQIERNKIESGYVTVTKEDCEAGAQGPRDPFRENYEQLPWVGNPEEDRLKEKILELSTEKKTFVRNPPAGVAFEFNYRLASKQALLLLEEDSNLKKMRYDLVPKEMPEETFWRNYFYRISLVKKANIDNNAHITAGLGLGQRTSSTYSSRSKSSGTNVGTGTGSSKAQTSVSKIPKNSDNSAGDDLIDNDGDFISNELEAGTEISAEDLKAEMAALGMEGSLEEELNLGLEDYEVIDDQNESGQVSADWEKEVDDMLM